MQKIWFYIQQYIHRIWFRCVVYCLMSLSIFFILPFISSWLPSSLGDGQDAIGELVSQDALAELLKVLANSMLAVSIFSLSIVVQAFQSAATTTTPRANELMMQNATAHNALGTFIGAFLFSIVGTIAIRSGVYDTKILNVLFAATVVIIAIIVIVLLKWIDEVSKLGRVNVTVALVESALTAAIKHRAKNPFLSAQHYPDHNHKPIFKHLVYSSRIGYVQYIDVQSLNTIAEEQNIKIGVEVNPGVFCDGTEALICSSEEVDADIQNKLMDCFVIGTERTYSQDPRYGFVVLTAIALRALSPGINDPGTAVSVLGTQLRALHLWVRLLHSDQDAEPALSESQKSVGLKEELAYMDTSSAQFPCVFVKTLKGEDMMEDIFGQLIRDGSGNHIVATRLRKMLNSICYYQDLNLVNGAEFWLNTLEAQVKTQFSTAVYDRIMGKG